MMHRLSLTTRGRGGSIALGIALLVLAVAQYGSTTQVFADFGQSQIWHEFFCIDNEVCRVGDVNGDGRDDIVTFVRSTKGTDADGDVIVALSDGSRFGQSQVWHEFFCIGAETCDLADVNGDGRDDIVAFVRSTQTGDLEGDVWVALSTGSGFGQSQVWHPFFCIGAETCAVGDFNGDGLDDIVAFVRSTQAGDLEGDVFVALSTGSGFGQSAVWHEFFCIGGETCEVGDVTGDGRADIITFVGSTQPGDAAGDVFAAVSTGNGFGQSSVWHDLFCIGDETCLVAEVDGNGVGDIVTFVRSTQPGEAEGDVFVAFSGGDLFSQSFVWHPFFCITQEVCAAGDVNGDGRDDIVAFVRSTQPGDAVGDVFVALSQDGPAPRPQVSAPTDAPPAAPTQPPAGGDGPGLGPALARPGDVAMVGVESLLLYDSFGHDSQQLGRIFEGFTVNVIVGPLEINGEQWVFVRVRDTFERTTGWVVAQSANGQLTLFPTGETHDEVP